MTKTKVETTIVNDDISATTTTTQGDASTPEKVVALEQKNAWSLDSKLA